MPTKMANMVHKRSVSPEEIKKGKLEPVFKNKWLKALRSGRYRQGNGLLRSLDAETGEVQYCCLGVACNVINRNKWQKSDEGGFDWGIIGKGGISSTQTEEFPFMAASRVSSMLASANDDGIPFTLIADWIEEYL